MEHAAMCPLRVFNGTHSDPAKRLSDHWNLHRIADPYGSIGRWFAIRLSDGISDGVLYDTKRDAIRHQPFFEYLYAFVRLSLASMNVCDAEIYLAIHRRLYDKGFRMTDPDARNGGPDVIKRSSREDMLALTRGVATNLYLPGRDDR